MYYTLTKQNNHMFFIHAIVVAFSVQSIVHWPWFVVNVHPNDPTLTCHVGKNGTWYCAPDLLLRADITNNEDSY